jgi:hypothetical protein
LELVGKGLLSSLHGFFSKGEGAADLNWCFNVGASMKSSSGNVDGAEGGFFLHDKLVPFYGHE